MQPRGQNRAPVPSPDKWQRGKEKTMTYGVYAQRNSHESKYDQIHGVSTLAEAVTYCLAAIRETGQPILEIRSGDATLWNSWRARGQVTPSLQVLLDAEAARQAA